MDISQTEEPQTEEPQKRKLDKELDGAEQDAARAAESATQAICNHLRRRRYRRLTEEAAAWIQSLTPASEDSESEPSDSEGAHGVYSDPAGTTHTDHVIAHMTLTYHVTTHRSRDHLH